MKPTKKIDQLIESIAEKDNPTAIGLDTRVEYLPADLRKQYGDSREEVAKAVTAFNFNLIDAVHDIIPCVKVQVACYEMLGPAGMEAFRQTLLYAKQHGMMTIADVKRNDIGSTAEAYAEAYLGENAPFPADFVTVNAYLGKDGVAPFLSACNEHGGGIFILVRTSNPSAGELQNLTTDGKTLYEHIGDKVEEWGTELRGIHGYSSVGAVVGATWPQESTKLRALLPHTFFLVPGYGAQGASAKDLAGCFDAQGSGAIINASRSLLCAYKKAGTSDFASASYDEAIRMREDLRSVHRKEKV